MPMLKIARMEKLAQEFVARCGDEVESFKAAYPEKSEGKTPYKIKRMYEALIKGDAAFWRRVAELQKPIEEKIALDAEGVMREWSNIALGDFAAISDIRSQYMACRCGADDEKGDDEPLEPVCEACGRKRRRVKYVHVADTDELTDAQKRLYVSAEQTKHGIKVHVRDPDAALLNIAKARGMFTERMLIVNNQPELPPLPDDPMEATRLYNEWVKGT